jgi:hypothetical protein
MAARTAEKAVKIRRAQLPESKTFWTAAMINPKA